MTRTASNPLEIEYRDLDSLLPYARNPRKNDQAVERMAASIREFGFRIPILVDSSGTIIDGHLRLKAARNLGLKSVPVIIADGLSKTQIKAFRLLANRSVAWAEWDEELLSLELKELEAMDIDLELTGFDPKEIQSLLDFRAGASDPALDQAPALEDTPAVVQSGELWSLGKNHRLLCGDATNPDHLSRLMDGRLADMVFTDPPYNVNYSRGTRPGSGPKRILNDNLGGEFHAFLERACENMLAVTKGAIYICMSSSELHSLHHAFITAGGKWSTYIIWAKNTFTLGRADYQRQYEPILYGWPAGNKHYWCGDRSQGDVWFFDKPVCNDLHPTMKPVSLVRRAVNNSSKSRDIVFDPFGGSGSTLIACEDSGRTCFMMELDPRYCDVIIKRWQDIANLKAERI